jgi:TonB family protein
VFGLPEDALSETGDLAVATGNTLMAGPDSVVRPAPPPLPPAPPAVDLEGPYLESLRKEVARHYPSRARKFRQEGTVKLRLVLARSGRILELALLQGSGHEALDRGVIEGLERLGSFAPFPHGIPRDRWELEMPVNFRLR